MQRHITKLIVPSLLSITFAVLQNNNTNNNNITFCESKTKDTINKCFLSFVKDPRKEICDEIINEETSKLAVQKNGWALEFIKPEFQTEEICKLAVMQNGLALEFVKPEFQTEEICRLAVTQNGWAIKFVKHDFQTKEILKLAFQQNPLVLVYMPTYYTYHEKYDT
jgi:hypothetical protein